MTQASLDREGGPLPLAEGFPPHSAEDWQRLVATVLATRRPDDDPPAPEAAVASLRTAVEGGLTVEPLYLRPADHRPLGVPGRMPFTRGRVLRDPGLPWHVRQRHDDPDAARSRAAVFDDLENGVTSVWVHMGEDGVALGDLPEVLADVRLDLAPVVVSSHTDQPGAVHALLAHAGDREVAGLHLGLDPVGAALRLGAGPDLEPLAGLVGAAASRPSCRALCVDTTVLHDAGASEVDALAVGLATAVTYLRHLASHDLAPATTFGGLEWRVPATADQFLTAATLRALRRVWARVGEACGVPEADRGALTHAVTSLRMTTREDPFTNVLRTTVAVFGASVGGADAITVLPHDTASGLPERFSLRLARNTQILLAEEAGVGRVGDPGGGSWYLEALTDHLAHAVWQRFQEVERAGGVQRALADGVLHEWVAAANAERDRAVATRRRPVVGTSTFPDLGQAPPERRPRAVIRAGERALAPRRETEAFERLRARARAAAEPPAAVVRTLGSARDHGPRQTFIENTLAAGGIRVVESGSPVAVLASSTRLYAEQGADAVAHLRTEGANHVLLAGRASELGDAAGAVDGEVYAGSDVVGILEDLLDRLGAPAAGGTP
ncbi:MAG: methylmalonyl-CoA mutase subunit beta [Dermatophilaceae bacterium]